jgi:hypothetical protein
MTSALYPVRCDVFHMGSVKYITGTVSPAMYSGEAANMGHARHLAHTVASWWNTVDDE